MPTERERMLAGEFYDSRDPELLALAHRARALLAAFHSAPSTDGGGRHAILSELFAGVGEGVWIEPPFFCDYGAHVTIGAYTFVNVNGVFLDSATIRIGSHGLLGPGVLLLTPHHPLRADDRVPDGWTPASDRSPYRTMASPIAIGDHVWIGGGTIVMPGVTIGDRVTIGAGSVVTSDIPSDVLAFGNPCRVQRPL